MPTIDLSDIDDDEALAEVVDALIHHLDHQDGELVALREELQLQQRILRDVACDAAWAQFLVVEQVTTARTAELALRLVRFGVEAGRRLGQPAERR